MHIRRNDMVVAIAGRNKGSGKPAKVLHAIPKKKKVVVEGLSLVKKAMRKTQDNPRGGIGEKESPIAVSNLMLYCPECKKGVKISHAKEGGRKVRKCRKCGHVFEG